jgi:diguanylate cyclase
MAEKTPLPPLMVTDAEELVRDMEKALGQHRAWMEKFHTMLVCRTKPRPFDLSEKAHLRCGFGKWFDDGSNDYLRNHPGFAALGDHHQQLHAEALILARIVRDGENIPPERYHDFTESVGIFKMDARALLTEAREILRHTDPLTGVANRFAMLPRIEQERQRIRRSDEKCSVSMVDIDKFKRVNDTYGHHAGDKVLQGIARYLMENLRRYDQVCRYGGEEFLVMLPNTAPDEAKRVLDRLRRGLVREDMAIGGGEAIHISASFGIAALIPRLSVFTAIDRADKAMYTAKKAGRNQVCVWKKKSKKKAKAKG